MVMPVQRLVHSEANVCASKATVQSSKDEEDDHRVIPRHDKYFADCRLRSKPASPSVILDLASVSDSSSKMPWTGKILPVETETKLFSDQL